MNPHKKILIVDDEIINADFFDVMLSKLGFVVEKANDGVEALEKIKKFHPDLIMLDNIMPRMSGWELTKTLKENPKFKEIPIIMFSALDDVKDKVESFELGVDDYITKPFNFSEVLARIRVILRNRDPLSREFRSKPAEALDTGTLESFIKSMEELEAALAELSFEAGAGTPLEKERFARSVEALKKKTAPVRDRIKEIRERIGKTAPPGKPLTAAETAGSGGNGESFEREDA
ncbi:MAG: response regulator transcription factor [Spirochaetaceae bacterium]|jgi:DNA-binding response OmpR family regulator|nr:response regulator transcription factor [Spirochaetaceae bacterium]